MSFETGFQIFKERPLLGLGYGNYGAYVANTYSSLSDSEILIIS